MGEKSRLLWLHKRLLLPRPDDGLGNLDASVVIYMQRNFTPLNKAHDTVHSFCSFGVATSAPARIPTVFEAPSYPRLTPVIQ